MEQGSLRRRAMAGEPVPGAMVFEFFTPGMAQLLHLAGAQFAMFDMEHTGLSLETLKTLVATCRGLPLVPMTRVPRGEYHFLARALDVGCQGVMIPMVESAAQARSVAEATRYPPAGRRGAAFGFANDGYSGQDVLGSIRAIDERTIVIAQIETERGLEAVEEIAAVDGIDVLWVGHFDLTNFLGIPTQFEHPTFLAALDRVVAAGRKHGKGLGFMAADAATATRYRRLGFNMLAAGTDTAVLTAGYRAILAPVGGRA